MVAILFNNRWLSYIFTEAIILKNKVGNAYHKILSSQGEEDGYGKHAI